MAAPAGTGPATSSSSAPGARCAKTARSVVPIRSVPPTMAAGATFCTGAAGSVTVRSVPAASRSVAALGAGGPAAPTATTSAALCPSDPPSTVYVVPCTTTSHESGSAPVQRQSDVRRSVAEPARGVSACTCCMVIAAPALCCGAAPLALARDTSTTRRSHRSWRAGSGRSGLPNRSMRPGFGPRSGRNRRLARAPPSRRRSRAARAAAPSRSRARGIAGCLGGPNRRRMHRWAPPR